MKTQPLWYLTLLFIMIGTSACSKKPMKRYSHYKVTEEDLTSIKELETFKTLPLDYLSKLSPQKFEWIYPRQKIRDKELGFKNNKNVQVRHIKTNLKKIIYDVKYTFDEYHRRQSINDSSERNDQFIALFGCSFTFGTGLDDKDSLHNIINNYSQKYYAYNYGISSSGPNLLLRMLETKNLKKEMSFESGHFIYVFNDFHIRRVNGFLVESGWMGGTPKYEKIDGHLQFQGTIKNNSLVKYWYYRSLDTIFKWMKVRRNIPRSISDVHYSYMCDLIENSKHKFEEQFPKGKFQVYFHPLQESGELHTSRIKSCLKTRKISYFQSNIEYSIDKHTITEDGHPNGELNQLIGHELLEMIN